MADWRNIYKDPWTKKFAVKKSPLFFDLNNDIQDGIDIESRMRSAERFVNKAIEYGALSNRRQLLVIGAGVAGVSAAITALKHHVPVTIKDGARAAFDLQKRCKTRWLHPNQYKWPAPEYEHNQYPWLPGLAAPLTWRAAHSHRVALQWNKQLNSLRKSRRNLLTVQYRTPVRIDEPTLLESYIKLAHELNSDEQFGIILACMGTPEKASLKPFRGYRFWESDRLREPGCGLSDKSASVLISGGGDGAQQDLLRIALKPHPLKMILRLKKTIDHTAAGRQWWDRLESGITRMNRRAATSLSPATLRDLANFYDSIFRQNPSIVSDLRETLQDALCPHFERLQITFSFQFPHVPWGYPLNRFLVELLRNSIMERFQHEIYKPNLKIELIKPHHRHRCDKSAADCYGRSHEIHFRNLVNNSEFNGYYHIIVIRHGLNLPRLDMPHVAA